MELPSSRNRHLKIKSGLEKIGVLWTYGKMAPTDHHPRPCLALMGQKGPGGRLSDCKHPQRRCRTSPDPKQPPTAATAHHHHHLHSSRTGTVKPRWLHADPRPLHRLPLMYQEGQEGTLQRLHTSPATREVRQPAKYHRHTTGAHHRVRVRSGLRVPG